MSKKYFKIYIPVIVLIFIISAISIFAATYTPLEPGAFVGVGEKETKNLATFLGQVFNWGISIAVVLALVMIILGGIQYMTTDSWEKKDEGKTRIQDAIIGLGLALVSWLILYTINPCLVDFLGSDKCKSANTLLSLKNTNDISHQTIINHHV